MSSDEADKKNVEEPSKEAGSSAEENEEMEEKPKEDKVNNKAAAKKKGADPPKIKQPPKKRVKSDQEEKETKKDDKKENKKKAAEKEEEDEEEDEESGEENDMNHKAVPLLDQPLEISGKRQSRVVQRFKAVEPEEETKEVKIPEGKGKVLGEIERIEFNIQRAKPEDLKLLHRLCFGKPGKAATVKKILKKFNGFEYSVGSEEFKKKKEFVDKSFKKVTVAHLKNVCNILDIERGGSKDDLIERILKFITCPIDSGKKLPGGGRSKRKGASNKNYEEGEESHKSKKKNKSKKKDAESEESEKEDEDEEEEEEEEQEKDVEEKEEEENKNNVATEESEEEKEEEEEKPKKGAKKGKKAAEPAAKKAPPKKRAAAKKAAEKKSDSEADADGEDDSEEDEPLSKKAKTPPTDEDIKTYVKSLLEGANLELITMKKVCQDVYAHYPDFDLAHKKDFIKTTVKNLIST